MNGTDRPQPHGSGTMHVPRRRALRLGVGALLTAGLLDQYRPSIAQGNAPAASPLPRETDERRNAMIVYQPHAPVPDSAFVDLGSPEALGGKVLEGSPRISARIDFNEHGMMAGIFEATTGTVEIHFPFTEHATILEGKVTITDASGQSHTFRPGDSYLIEQGQVVIWDVQGERVRKSFFNVTQK